MGAQVQRRCRHAQGGGGGGGGAGDGQARGRRALAVRWAGDGDDLRCGGRQKADRGRAGGDRRDERRCNGVHEQRVGIQKWTIAPRDLSVSGGELTPTLKVKRGEVMKSYAAAIDAMYESREKFVPFVPNAGAGSAQAEPTNC